jgi:peroxiredoxin (alkyl hydroperoxide reductase subunit C)
MLRVGMRAPDFTLDSTMGKIALSDYKDNWIVMFFYPLDFSSVCGTEIPEINRRLNEFEELGARVLAVNTDSVYSHKAWLEKIGQVDYPVMSDYSKALSRSYGVLDEETGIACRSTFIIDTDHKVRYASEVDMSISRSIDEVIRVLSMLVKGSSCTVELGEDREQEESSDEE